MDTYQILLHIDSAKFTSTSILVDDVILHILSFCDLSSILSFSLANRQLFALSQRKEVWVNLILEFQREGFVDLKPGTNARDLSVAELVEQVKRCVLGPETWTDSDPAVLEVESEIVLKWPSIDPAIAAVWKKQSLFLPGGRFIFVSHFDGLECKDVFKDEIIWKYDCRWPLGKVRLFTANNVCRGIDGIEDGVIIVVGVRTFDQSFPDRRNYIDVLQLNLEEGTSTSHHVVPIPDSDSRRDNPFEQIYINHDCVLVNLGSNPKPGTILVLHLLSGIYSFWTCESPRLDMSLIPGHLVALIKNTTNNCLDLRIWDMKSLIDRHNTDLETSVLPILNEFPAIHSETVDFQTTAGMFRISTHPSPLFSNASRLWIVILCRRPRRITFHRKYLIRHPKIGSISVHPTWDWKETVGVPVDLPGFHFEGGISYAGAMVGYNEQPYLRILSSDDNGNGICRKDLQTVTEPGEEENCTFVSAFSGAVVFDADNTFVIRYYR